MALPAQSNDIDDESSSVWLFVEGKVRTEQGDKLPCDLFVDLNGLAALSL